MRMLIRWKKEKKKSSKHFHNILNINNNSNNINNNSTLEEINFKFDEKDIYEMAMKINKPNEIELNSLPYKEAIKNDNRTYCMYYLSLIRTKHLLIFSFMKNFRL